MGTNRMTEFIHEYLATIRQLLLVCTTGVTCEYSELISNCLQAVYLSCRMSPTCELHIFKIFQA